MSDHKVMVLRHSAWDYKPNGRGVGINASGLEKAKAMGRNLRAIDAAYASEYVRAQQTAEALCLGQPNIITLGTFVQLNELEFPGEFPTAKEYTQFVFKEHLEEAVQRAKSVKQIILGTPSHSNVVMVSHRVLMIALYTYLSYGSIQPEDYDTVDFEPLGGFEILVFDRELHVLGTIKP